MSKTRLSEEEFVLRAIEKLADLTKSKGIHTVFSGFNAAFREYFPDTDPVEITKKLQQEGKIVIRPAFRGVMIYRPGDVKENNPKKILNKMGV